ncbi:MULTISPECIES: glucokinase [unclassified Prochlorococcus]|uniref:glucokinase n=1 Tax=unclassified Prochlorococcus TaxID=2627481 RepID=UPI000533AF28|nr:MULTISPECIES: glucokinase [unclassified Prochlorococcus]KGG15391.1 Glucokinase [Prochlorococcus sp. MIT 0602]KGG17669.1 Glucokinase [Prochlorococcus sp. MIT 0603]
MNLLAADVGGTKTLLGIYEFKQKLNLINSKSYKSKEWDGLDLILNHYLSNLSSKISQPKYACIGLAGYVSNGSAELTNLGWKINEELLKQEIGVENITIINDFSCLIYAIPFLEKSQYEIIQYSKNKDPKNITPNIYAILGAGTGLGVARGLITSTEIKVLPSEGGHREFAPRNDSEWELSKWLKINLGLKRLSIERIVSGTGLVNIARWRLTKEDAKFHPLNRLIKSTSSTIDTKTDLAETINKSAEEGDPVMREVLDIWISAYGSAAGDIALQELCNDGLWIGGGPAARHIDNFKSESFLKSLRNKGRFSNYLEGIPVMAITDRNCGLFGAACKAHLMACRMPNLLRR